MTQTATVDQAPMTRAELARDLKDLAAAADPDGWKPDETTHAAMVTAAHRAVGRLIRRARTSTETREFGPRIARAGLDAGGDLDALAHALSRIAAAVDQGTPHGRTCWTCKDLGYQWGPGHVKIPCRACAHRAAAAIDQEA